MGVLCEVVDKDENSSHAYLTHLFLADITICLVCLVVVEDV